MLLHVRDITERRAAEAALQSSETLFRSVWENSVDGMRLTDEEGIIVAVNDAYCRLVGMEAQALEGKPFTVIYAASEDRDNMLEQHREAFLARSVDSQARAPVCLAQRECRDPGNHRLIHSSCTGDRC